MEWAQIPIIQGGAVVVVFAIVWLVVKGHLVPRSVLEDARKDRDERIAQAQKDRDERVAEAERDADRAWALYEKERDSHDLSRQALMDRAFGITAPALAMAETGVKILTELQEHAGGADG